MNKVLIVDAFESDHRLILNLLMQTGYKSTAVESIEAAKDEVDKLPPRQLSLRISSSPTALQRS